jgi:hypothetical protein
MMGEGTIHAFKNKYDAELYAAENDGLSLGQVTYAKPPSKVYAVIGGDRGCFVHAASAFPEKALAESAAAKKNKTGKEGLSYYVFVRPLRLPGRPPLPSSHHCPPPPPPAGARRRVNPSEREHNRRHKVLYT